MWSFDHRCAFCVSVCAAAGQSDQFKTGVKCKSPKRLKLQTSKLTHVFLGTVRTGSLKKIFEKGAWPGSRDALNFWALNARPNTSKMVKATDL